MNSTIADLLSTVLYNMFNSPAFFIILAVWVIICLVWKTKRTVLVTNLVDLVSKPIIFKKDDNPKSVQFYPRALLEDFASGLKKLLNDPLCSLVTKFRSGIQNEAKIIYKEEKPWRTIGYILLLVLLVAFVIADTIAIANTLANLGFIDYVLPDLLNRYEIAAAMGSLFAIIIGVFILSEILSKDSEFTSWSEKTGRWKDLAKVMSVYLMIFGLIVVVFYGLSRLSSLGFIQQTSFIDTSVNFVVLVLVPLNTVVATALIFEEGLKGFFVLLVGIQWIIWATLICLNYISEAIGVIFPFVLDIVLRIALFCLYLFFYIIITPLEWAKWVLTAPLRWFKPTVQDPENVEFTNKK